MNLKYFRYIIQFGAGDISAIPRSISSAKQYEKIRLDSKRKYDPNDPKWTHFMIAAAHFWRKYGAMGGHANKQIDYIEYVVNQDLQRKFDDKKAEFRRKKIPDQQIMAFHATNPANIDSIIKSNLDHRKYGGLHGRAHGDGNYFSEYPAFSLRYGNGLILFEILPGNENPALGPVQCKKVAADSEGYGQQLVITDNAQFFPRYVIHLK